MTYPDMVVPLNPILKDVPDLLSHLPIYATVLVDYVASKQAVPYVTIFHHPLQEGHQAFESKHPLFRSIVRVNTQSHNQTVLGTWTIVAVIDAEASL
jgi:hypothetical protein